MTREELNELAVNQYGITNAADMSEAQLKANIKDIDEQSDPGVAAAQAERDAEVAKKKAPARKSRRGSGKKRKRGSKG